VAREKGKQDLPNPAKIAVLLPELEVQQQVAITTPTEMIALCGVHVTIYDEYNGSEEMQQSY
jgi:hypothetical protein